MYVCNIYKYIYSHPLCLTKCFTILVMARRIVMICSHDFSYHFYKGGSQILHFYHNFSTSFQTHTAIYFYKRIILLDCPINTIIKLRALTLSTKYTFLKSVYYHQRQQYAQSSTQLSSLGSLWMYPSFILSILPFPKYWKFLLFDFFQICFFSSTSAVIEQWILILTVFYLGCKGTSGQLFWLPLPPLSQFMSQKSLSHLSTTLLSWNSPVKTHSSFLPLNTTPNFCSLTLKILFQLYSTVFKHILSDTHPKF